MARDAELQQAQESKNAMNPFATTKNKYFDSFALQQKGAIAGTN